ncbi:MAG TPA: protein kinase [Blastocatellia bacterium]|nr:protein kinase [Blastocatellia bacterium]
MSTTIAHYVVLEKIGQGGMGAVYRVMDTRLNRPVALKFLPPHLVQDPERLRRFVLEAQAASALNHPNIVTIYEIGSARPVLGDSDELSGDRQNWLGFSSDPNLEFHYIAMELVSGETLAGLIQRRSGDLKAMLGSMAQVADGLAKAHGAGIVHRDLKPDNVMITEDGYSKILDFGLAKLIEPGDASRAGSSTGPRPGESEDAPTAVMRGTHVGTVLGTAGYMSPEQVQGRTVDHRSDVFSFGCILYEIATGQRPFQAESIIDSMYKIVHFQPPPVTEVNPSAPGELQRIVRKCLAKDPAERYQSMKDAAVDLRALIGDLGSGTFSYPNAQALTGSDSGTIRPQTLSSGSSGAGRAEVAAVGPPLRRHWMNARVAALAVVVAVAVFGLLYVLAGLKHSESRLGLAFQNRELIKLTSQGKSGGACISPDGKYVAHIVNDQGQQSLWIRQIATASNVQIIPPAETDYAGVSFSPDGSYVYFSARDKGAVFHSLYRIPILGGAPRRILERVPCAVSFSPDGNAFTFVRDDSPRLKSSLMTAKIDGSGERELATQTMPAAFVQPAWSPDGKTIASSVKSFAGGIHMEIVAVPAAGGTPKQIPTVRWAEISGIQWLADSSAVLITAAERSGGTPRSQIWRVSYPDGQSEPVTNDLNDYAGISLTADATRLITLQFAETANIWLTPSGSGGPKQITSGTGQYIQVSSASAGRIACESDAAGTAADVFVMDADGKNQKQITSEGINILPCISPDGKYVVFSSSRSANHGNYSLWRADANGENLMRLTNGEGDYFPVFSPDGKWIYYTSVPSNDAPKTWRVAVDGGKPELVVELVSFIPVISPDGKYLACRMADEQLGSSPNPKHKLGLFALDGSLPIKSPLKLVSLPGSDRVEPGRFRWAKDSKSILYIDEIGGISNIWSTSLDDTPPKKLTDFDTDQIFDFDVVPESNQFVCSRGVQNTDVVLIKQRVGP